MTLTEILAATLAEHQIDEFCDCPCGWEQDLTSDPPNAQHNAHVAERISDALGVERLEEWTWLTNNPAPESPQDVAVYRIRGLEQETR